MSENQNLEQKARDTIDALLKQAGWVVQSSKKIDLNDGLGQAVREYQTDVGPADYVLFVDKKAVGVIEAKREEQGHKITEVEAQTEGYASAKLKWVNNKQPLPFLYESTGIITRFTDSRDPKPRSREVFSFHRPETLKEWLSQSASLRERLQHIPILNPDKLPTKELRLRDCQETAIANLKDSFKADRPRALIQMATGAGKTYTAITSMYRLLKYAEGKRILFLVDTKNLGEQAEQEMMSYVPIDDNRKFTELYTVQRLKSPFIATDTHVCISTVQRLYSILKDTPLDEAVEDINPAEMKQPKTPMPVVYSEKVPPEFFDFIYIDECHRSIYNLWQQVIDYFDASLIGLTATPDNRTYGFFKKNLVSDYSHEKAVADGVNVGNEIYVIETQITQQGAQISAQQQVERREKLTLKKRWEQQDEDEAYSATQLDRNIVNPDQIRTVIRTFRDKLPEIFPGRKEVPKTLIFAKTDSHAADNAQALTAEFAEYLAANRDNIEALTIFFSQPQRRRELSFDLIRQVLDKLKADQPKLAPLRVWQAYRQLDDYKGAQPISELTALVALIRRVCGMDEKLSTFDDTVRRNFQNWIMKHHSGGGDKFNEQQMDWLRIVRDHVANSFHIERDDLDMTPFDGQGGLGKMYQLFGANMDTLLSELNEALVA